MGETPKSYEEEIEAQIKLYRSTNVRIYLSHDIKMIINRIFGKKKSIFCHFYVSIK